MKRGNEHVKTNKQKLSLSSFQSSFKLCEANINKKKKSIIECTKMYLLKKTNFENPHQNFHFNNLIDTNLKEALN